ncbi:mitochondrial fission ELM1 family protein [Dyella telluris]|uniref:Mitochondrial fission ELM1 family protein n=1 Tax=Dyella telluris TaxID=2763498 RepID=A0A7G8Q839_9GAMM|nr:mitochondrial fission ELM1 family protein [Dyella telluris]QNK02947.1 mitochondrial fission ELM1 family protein [Dyella telluris]
MKPHGDCWVITDDAAGNQRQALALAHLLSMPVRHLQLAPAAPWSWLAPRLTLGARLALDATQRRQFAAPWPAVAIGCGRSAALYTRMLRALSRGRCYTVQILDPRVNPEHWDTVISPQHDQLSGRNVIRPLGSLNPVDDDWLQDGRDADPAFETLPRPRVGVLLGGPRKGVTFDESYIDQLIHGLHARRRLDGGSLLVMASRRTPPALVERMRQGLGDVPGLVWAGHDDGGNPYPGVLGWADRLVVTPDSVNMLSEACAVGCPVHTFVVGTLPDKLERFHKALRAAGMLYSLDARDTPPVPPLRETGTIAAVLRDLITLRQGSRK